MTVRSLLADPATIAGWRGWTARRKLVVAVAASLALPAGFALILLGRWPMIGSVATGMTPEYPYLKPLTFPELPHVVFGIATGVVERMPGWTLESADGDEHIIRARVVSRPFGFESEITISIHRADALTKVNVRSETVGPRRTFGDFGQNARNIRRLLKELEWAVAQQSARVPES